MFYFNELAEETRFETQELGAPLGSLFQIPRDHYITFHQREDPFMSVQSAEPQDQERPCLHCVLLDLLEDFYAQFQPENGEPEIDTDEALEAIAKTVAEFTSRLDGDGRQKLIEQLMRQVMEYDAEFRRENESGTAARH